MKVLLAVDRVFTEGAPLKRFSPPRSAILRT